MKAEPRVSVIIPAYNGEEFIGETIQSILDQTYPAFEIVIVDDGSTDRTVDVVKSFRSVVLVTQKNAGPAEARNTGIRASSGELIALLDNDDLWKPTKLERQVALLTLNPDFDGAFTLLRHFMTEGEQPPASLRPHLLETNVVGHTPSTFIIRRSSFEQVGWFSQQHHAEDADWFFRAKDAGLNFGVVEEALVLKRVRGDSISGTPERVLNGVVASARASIVRQRDMVSVLIPTYNGARYIKDAIQSVVTQRVPLETIVVDDGSTDGTLDLIAGDPRIRCFQQENAGTAAALNRAVEKARGGYLAFLDQDDRWVPGKLVRQLEVLKTDSTVDMVQGHLCQFISPEVDRALLTGDGRTGPAPLPGTTLIRRGALERVGPFNEQLTVGYFADWMFRANEAGIRIRMLDDVLLERRLHASNQSADAGGRAEYARVAKAALDRRRKQNS